ncbi:MAG TPA: trypsin-like peptidase domain-containing protein [Blastocatellia bacterium]|jgi:putative serine protease PepD|nr:trypsin-like peptidase domain-containing protein [Blastocatellia bacterium]
MYKITGKQLVSVALCSAVMAGVIVACAQRALDRAVPAVEPIAIADPTVASEEQNNVEIYHAVSPGVVNITNRSYQENFWGVFPSEGAGSGSIIDEKGDILTNYHVVQGASQLEVQVENDKFPATLVGTDRDNDLAIIRIQVPSNYRLTPVKLGSSQGLQIGQKVLAIGNPFGLQRTLTTGIISGLERPLRDSAARRTINGAIQTDAAINPGNSGGPLLNSKGEMIGINTAIQASAGGGSIGIGFAVPVDIAKRIIPEIISKGYVARPWLGVTTMPLNTRIARAFQLPSSEGIIVGDVYRGSGAAAAGLRGATIRESMWGGVSLQQLGDVIVAVGGRKVANTDDLQTAMQDKKPGETVDVEVIRERRRATIPVRLSERPVELR